MPKLRVLTEAPPPERGSAEQQLRDLRNYLGRVTEELEYILTHLETDNTSASLWNDIDAQIPGSYGGTPAMDGTASPGASGLWARGDHRHPSDSSKASAAALAAHVGDTDNPHGVTAAQTGAAEKIEGIRFCVCGTAAGTQAKTVTVAGVTALTEGLQLRVKFTYAQTYNGAPTLNVNGLGAVNIRRKADTNAARYEWNAGEVLDLVYDGTYWVIIDGTLATTTYYGVTKLSSSTSSTSTSLAATPSAVKAAYDLASGAIPASQKGAANGVAELDENGMVPSAQLPSYVDDVLEYASQSAFPAAGESGKIYVALDTNLTYRWSGSAYVEISPSLALGETSSTAYRGDRGKTAYDHSQVVSGNPHNVTAAEVGARPDTWTPSASDVGAQPAITANGILKGDGAGAVSAAAAGTDYQAPLVAGTDYATPAMIPSVPQPSNSYPQALGASSPGTSTDYARADHVHQKPTYSKSDVGLGNVANVLQYSASNPPPAPDASQVGYDDSVTQWDINNVQDAIGKLVDGINDVELEIPLPSNSNPIMDGTASPGSSSGYSRADHVHPSDTSKQDKVTANGILKGDGNGGVSAATAGTDYQTPLTAGTDYATPAMIPSVPSASDASPQMDGTAAAGSSADYSRADHVHPLDSKILKNNANNASSLSIMGGATSAAAGNMVAIGSDAWTANSGDIAIGKSSRATGVTSIAFGFQANATAANAVQIGAGTNADANTVKVGYRTLGTNYELLDANGIIPVGRMPYTFDTEPTQNSTNPVTSGGVYTAIRDRNARADSIFSTVTEITSGGITITPTDDWAGYSYLAITLNTSSTNPAAERMAVVVPVVLIQYSNWFPVARNGVYGAVQVGRVSNSSQLTFKTDLTSLYVVNVRRVK